jgi:hypothetical protein
VQYEIAALRTVTTYAGTAGLSDVGFQTEKAATATAPSNRNGIVLRPQA